MTAEAPSFVADVAAQVVAWHNRHPLARRITRKDVQGIGTVVLPYAREGQPPWDAPQPKRSLLALMFPPRRDCRLWPLFSEDLVPEIGLKRLVRFGARHGLERRPGPADLPERVAITEPDRLERPGAAYPPERVDRFLVSAAIDIGPNRPRLMLGGGKRPPVLGQRLWSLPRLAVLGGSLLLAMVIGVAGLWLKAMAPRPAAPGATLKAASSPTAGSAAARVAASGPVQVSAGVAPASAPASASPAASAPAAATPAAAPRPVMAPAVTASAVPPAAAPAPAAVPAPTHGGAASAALPAPPASATVPAPIAPVAPPQASAAAVATVPAQRASAPLVPRLKPDLAASARAEADGRALRPAAAAASAAANPPLVARPAPPPIGASPGPRPAAPAAAASSARFYALVTRPTRSKADAEALLRRLRTETDRIGHPTASQTGLLESAEGWRVTWWPFTHQRQADNARNALARRFELEVVEF